ncbi:AGAP005230-PA-like protein [Anopheles sinensis]|uniref:AGAP005230-PA-like protein n=1 Tax=Anopheles sinensis TaxID=74873 RepID=A0A084WCN1_ANOSI|nr:AGAP005230-PA-like protein [Anopheles sinensis]
MTKAMKTKDRKSMQVCREHKTLQVRFQKQENSLLALQNENKSLHQRVRQYETCLDDIMRKVVDALVAEDSLRDEVAILKGRVRDLEAQNAALVTHASPAKSRDEGYCTMSSGQPQPPAEGHLEELPEEPEQWLMSAEPCTADMEDWSMSQEELATALDEENHEWIWNSSFLTTAETQTEDITALLHDQIVYSEDEEVACTNFTRDFYRLVSFTSGSTRSLQSPSAAGGPHGDGKVVSDSSDEDDVHNGRRSQSPTPSDGNWAQVHSCSSSESSDALTEKLQLPPLAVRDTTIDEVDSIRRSHGGRITPLPMSHTADLLQDVLITCHSQLNGKGHATKLPSYAQSPASATWRRSTGWRRVQRGNGAHETHIPVPIGAKDRLKSPPPVPIRRTYAS